MTNEQAPAEAPKSPSAKWRQRIKNIIVDVLIIGAIFFGVQMWRARDMLSTKEPAPTFALTDLATQEVVALDDFEGDRVMLHFWAPWCPVCQREFGMLNRFSEKAPDGVHVVSIVYDWQDLDYIRDYVREHDIRFQVLLGNDQVTQAYQVSAFPTNYYISGSGQIRSRSTGLASPWGMRSRISCAR